MHDGERAIEGAPCAPSGTTCDLHLVLSAADPAELAGYGYLRITDRADRGLLRIVTSPIWVE